MPNQHISGGRIPAAPTWDHITTLLNRGWTKTAIAHAIGQQSPGLQLARRHITKRNAELIKALLDLPTPSAGHIPTPILWLTPHHLDPDTDWTRHGACRTPDIPTWIFFADARTDRHATNTAKAICATCPVTGECRAYAERNNELGIWGGTTESQRRPGRQVIAS